MGNDTLASPSFVVKGLLCHSGLLYYLGRCSVEDNTGGE